MMQVRRALVKGTDEELTNTSHDVTTNDGAVANEGVGMSDAVLPRMRARMGGAQCLCEPKRHNSVRNKNHHLGIRCVSLFHVCICVSERRLSATGMQPGASDGATLSMNCFKSMQECTSQSHKKSCLETFAWHRASTQPYSQFRAKSTTCTSTSACETVYTFHMT